MTFSPLVSVVLFPMTRFLFTQEPKLIVLLSYSRWGDGKSTAIPIFISAAESAPAEIAARVPVGSAPELSHKRTEPQPSCRACGTNPRGLNAPGSNLPVRHVPGSRRSAPDQPLDRRTLQWPRHDLDVQPAKAEFVAIGCRVQQSAASQSQPPIPLQHE